MKSLVCGKTADIFKKALADRVTPGAVLGVSVENGEQPQQHCIYCCGYTSYGVGKEKVTDETVYDLASLTKPLVTVLCLLTFLEKGRVTLDSTLAEMVPSWPVPVDKRKIRLRQLMSHSSGLPAHRNYFVQMLGMDPSERKSWLLKTILSEELLYKPGSKHVYSDLGFLLLGWIVEELSGKKLDEYHQETVLKTLDFEGGLFFNNLFEKVESSKSGAATEICPWTYKQLVGQVHDDNCRLLGGVCGHAGLFGTVDGVLKTCRLLQGVSNGWHKSPLFSTELLHDVTRRIGTSTWCCGFDMPSKLYSSSGKYFSPTSIGHLGFSGTSFWIDLQKGISIVLLTNRVHPERSNEQIKRLRPKIHNAVMEQLIGYR